MPRSREKGESSDAKGKGASGKGRGTSKGKGKGKAKTPSYASDTPGYRWVEKVKDNSAFRRASLFATQSCESGDLSMFPGNTRVTQLQTDSAMLGVLECVLVEPAQKQLIGKAFDSTGVIICLHGMPPSQSLLGEWGRAITAAGWTDLSCTVVIPNVQMSSALQLEDYEAIVDASLKLADFSRCLIVGKAWGAQRAVEIATLGTLGGKVEGVILVAPSSPAPEICCDLAVPALVVWASDDDVSSFEDSTAWKEALDDRCAPTSFLKCNSGGHRLDLMLADRLSAQAVRNFTAGALLVGELEDDAEDDGVVANKKKSEREQRLSVELPDFVHDDEDGDEDDSEGEEPEEQMQPVVSSKERKSIKSMDIMNWMQAGMTTAAE